MYENQRVIDRIKEQLAQIDPKLMIEGYGLSGNRVMSLSIRLPVKGNRDVIKKLEETGWIKTCREKVRTDNHSCARCQSEGYEMWQTMRMRI